MGKIIWCFISLPAGFFWFAAAVGFWVPSAWLTMFAFVMVGLQCVASGLKILLEID